MHVGVIPTVLLITILGDCPTFLPSSTNPCRLFPHNFSELDFPRRFPVTFFQPPTHPSIRPSRRPITGDWKFRYQYSIIAIASRDIRGRWVTSYHHMPTIKS